MTFDLESRQRLERQMKGPFCTIRVKDLDDVNQAALDKFNKDSVVNFAEKATKLFKSCHGLLKSATAELDGLKTEHLQNQSKLIRIQEELSNEKYVQLDAVKNPVEEELTS